MAIHNCGFHAVLPRTRSLAEAHMVVAVVLAVGVVAIGMCREAGLTVRDGVKIFFVLADRWEPRHAGALVAALGLAFVASRWGPTGGMRCLHWDLDVHSERRSFIRRLDAIVYGLENPVAPPWLRVASDL